MNEFENGQQHQEVSPFLDGVIKWFQALMDKFTNGKYATEEEISFFSKESNLYDKKGKLTSEYKAKIKEFESSILNKDVNEFLHDAHASCSDNFGDAYNSDELVILSSACAFIDDQTRIIKSLKLAKQDAFRKRKKFDFDQWFMKYASENGISQENIDEAKKSFVEDIDMLLKEDKELLDLVKESFKNESEEN